jgi:hypothetical protein
MVEYYHVPTMQCVLDEDGNPLERVTQILQRADNGAALTAGQSVRTMSNEMRLGFHGFAANAHA